MMHVLINIAHTHAITPTGVLLYTVSCFIRSTVRIVRHTRSNPYSRAYSASRTLLGV